MGEEAARGDDLGDDADPGRRRGERATVVTAGTARVVVVILLGACKDEVVLLGTGNEALLMTVVVEVVLAEKRVGIQLKNGDRRVEEGAEEEQEEDEAEDEVEDRVEEGEAEEEGGKVMVRDDEDEDDGDVAELDEGEVDDEGAKDEEAGE